MIWATFLSALAAARTADLRQHVMGGGSFAEGLYPTQEMGAGFHFSLLQSAAAARVGSRVHARSRSSGTEAERKDGEGAPSDHYKKCADKGEDCKCAHGEVRFGSVEEDLWTQPIKLGDKESVKCDLVDISEARVHLEDKGGTEEPRQCQCVERLVRISAQQSSSATSFAQSSRRLDPPKFDVCLSIPLAAEHSDEDVIQHWERLESATEVVTEACDDAKDEQVWTWLLSSGQLRNNKSGKCLAVYWKSGVAHIRANDCTLVESQMVVQRWSIDSYLSPFSGIGAGSIVLGYGAHEEDPQCLASVSDTGVELQDCIKGGGVLEWELQDPAGKKHAWEKCAAEEKECSCIGEIRFGDGESDTWAAGVPVPNTLDEAPSVQCDLNLLRSIAIFDPVMIETIKDPGHRECQCRFDPLVDSEASDEDLSEAEETDNTAMYAGIGAAAVLVLGGGLWYFSSKKTDEDYAEEGEEEEGEEGEEEEEGEYEEEQ